ncbi:MAG: thioredoxin family protein [Planctomycetota bacterium]|nr:thioredoxin family protein [Planctomycetota bacterium]
MERGAAPGISIPASDARPGGIRPAVRPAPAATAAWASWMVPVARAAPVVRAARVAQAVSNVRAAAALAAFAMLAAAHARAIDAIDPDDPFKPPPPKPDRVEVEAGGTFEIRLTIPVPEGHHLSGGSIKVSPKPHPFITFDPAAVPPPVTKNVSVGEGLPPEPASIYEKDVHVRLPGKVLPSAPAGRAIFAFEVEYQGCADVPKYVCLPPKKRIFHMSLKIVPARPAGSVAGGSGAGAEGKSLPASDPAPPGPGSPAGTGAYDPSAADGGSAGRADGDARPTGAERSESGFLLTLLLMFVSGLGSALLPCVYPLIPIVLAVVGARKVESRRMAFLLALTFSAGVAVVYTALGTAAGLLGASFSGLMQSRWVVTAISVICFAMAFSMFGAFEVALPSSLQTRLSSIGGRGFGGAFVMGALSGVLASSCIGPVMISILALIAGRGSALAGFAMLLAYSIGFSLPYLVVGATAASLPKPGEWMVRVKKTGGIVLLGIGLWYLAGAIPREYHLLLCGVCGVFVAVFAGAFDQLSPAASAWERTAKAFGLLCFLAGAMALLGAGVEFGLPEILKSAPAAAGAGGGGGGRGTGAGPGGKSAESADGILWFTSEDEAAAVAKAQRKPMVLDFRSDTCAVCLALERTTFRDPAVIAESRRFVMVRIDLTGNPPDAERSRVAHRVMGLPTVLFFDADGRRRDDLTLNEYVGPEEFLARLRALSPQPSAR